LITITFAISMPLTSGSLITALPAKATREKTRNRKINQKPKANQKEKDGKGHKAEPKQETN